MKRKKSEPGLSPENAPRDLDAERAVLGGIILHGRPAFEKAMATGLRAEDFFSERHRLIFAAMARLHARSAPVEIASLRGDLEAADELVLAGGPAYLGSLIE